MHTAPHLTSLLSPEQAWHYRIVPHKESDGQLHLYIDSAADADSVLQELEILLGRSIVLDAVASAEIQQSLSTLYLREEKKQETFRLQKAGTAEDFLPRLISEAKNLKSSDIHIETYDQSCRIRIRIDGMMIERYTLSQSEYPALINKIKILSNLDIAERRLPQDGRIFFNLNEQKFDIRVSVLPTLHGEKVVLRLLSNDATAVDIHALGLSEIDLENYLEGIRRPNGIILISGPTGSGKTTTLYATLKLLNKVTRNILTIEDPIEYTLDGINQVQLKENIGLTFASALRTFLRQDPDVIMVGEIRDPETASMAIRASLTGHLVLSTIHTNSAWGTISRLIDMNIPPYLIANTLNTTVAQRLIRLLCPHCKAEESFSPTLFPRNFKPEQVPQRHFVAKGCEACYFTGYKGRKAVYEVIPIDFELTNLIKNNIFEIGQELKKRKIATLSENAFACFEKGETSLDEVYPLLLNY